MRMKLTDGMTVYEWKICVLRNRTGKWFWHLVGSNGQILCTSQTKYARKRNALETAVSVYRAMKERPHFFIEEVHVRVGG